MWIRRQGPTVEIHVPAKVNLFLEILAKRPDGFHELETLIAAIGVCDTLICEPLASDEIIVDCRWAAGCQAVGSAIARRTASDLYGPLPVLQDNLVWKAARRLQERSPAKLGARVVVHKRIPAAAGLGGASADAAATLVGLNLVWQLGLSRDSLAEIAAELGSDVPFFLRGGVAVCRGRGELVEPTPRLPPLSVTVARPPEGLGTPQVYRRCQVSAEPRSSAPIVAAWARGDQRGIGEGMKNQLQPPAAELSPWIGCLEQRTEGIGAIAKQMSGSGTSYFAIGRHARHARRMAGTLRAAGLGAVFSTRMPTGGE